MAVSSSEPFLFCMFFCVKRKEESLMPYRVYYDEEKCVACGTCSVACMDQNDINVDVQVPYRRVFTREMQKNGKVTIHYLSVGCMHCKNAPCMSACPQKCYFRDPESGLIQLDNTACIGCRHCNTACPLGVIGFGNSGKASKCNGCLERLKLGLKPACEKACQEGAIRFEYVEDAAEAGGDPENIEFLMNCL